MIIGHWNNGLRGERMWCGVVLRTGCKITQVRIMGIILKLDPVCSEDEAEGLL